MIFSMTGYGKGEFSDDNFIMSVEIKSVNHRFKDFRFKMPSVFNSKELELRKKLNHEFKRGSFEILVDYKRNNKQTESSIDIDFEKVNKFLASFKKNVSLNNEKIEINPVDFLRTDFYVDQSTELQHQLESMMMTAFESAIFELKNSRNNEGEKLQRVLMDNLNNYMESFKEIEELAEDFQEKVDLKLRSKILELSKEIKIDEPRFLQEVVYYLEKIDIHEEIDRINGHVSKLKSLLKNGGEVGRKIDFFVQELNRETNTIGSKSSDNLISESVVSMKGYLEKIREQGLNIE